MRSRKECDSYTKMKQYVIDDLRDSDVEKLAEYLEKRFGPAMLDRVYWVPLDPQYYTAVQAAHENCHPLYFALQLKPGVLAGEFLVRTHNHVRCECVAYANEIQRNWFITLIEDIVRELDVTV